MRRGLILFLVLTCVACVGELAFAQFPSRQGDQRRGDDFRRRIVQRMDRNGNGVVEPHELDDRARGFIQRMARDAGLDPNRPMPVDRLTSGDRTGGGQRRRNGDRRDDRGGGRGRDDQRRDRNGAQTEYTLVPRFGEQTSLQFGVNPLSLDGQVVDLEKRYDRGVLENVQRTMDRHDRNGSGILEYDEWKSIGWEEDPRQADLDGDGRLTKAEVAERTSKRNEQQRQDRDRRQRGRGPWEWSGRGGPWGPDVFAWGGRNNDRGEGGGDEGGGGRRRRGGGDGEDREGDRDRDQQRGPFGRGGFDPARMVERFDPDGDGVIKLDEMDDRTRMGAIFMLRRMGLDSEQPVKVAEVRKRMEEQTGQRGGDRQRAQAEPKEPSRDAYVVTGADRLKGRKSYASTDRKPPDNVPDWWSDKDENDDGQITMREFTSLTTAKSRDEFLQYDLNNDGFITAQEARGAQRQQ